MRLYEGKKLASGLWKSDVFVRDRQNVDAALRILQPQVRQCLQEWNDQCTEAIRIYLKIGYNMMKGYREENLSVKERAKLAWTAVCFVRLWKAWIELSSYMVESSFISLQTYNDMILTGHILVISMKLFAEHFPNEHFHPKAFGSDSCERLFARLRGFYRGKSNLCMLDILDICGIILKLEELKYTKTFIKRNSNVVVYDYRTGHTERVMRSREGSFENGRAIGYVADANCWKHPKERQGR